MKKPQRNADEELWNLMTALADSVFEASDSEILEETGRADEKAEETRKVLLDGVKRLREKHREQARVEYEEAVASMRQEKKGIPESIKEKRDLLMEILSARPQLSEALTAHFREFQEIPDDEVESYLKQLAELGVIDEIVDEDE